MEEHQKAVGKIAATVKQFFDRKESYRIFHGSTNSTRPLARDQRAVDISALSHVLSVNKTSRTALVEPNVPMDRLVEHTLKHGLVPPVVMEFPGITAGGGYAGTAGESSSFKHGFFDDTINSVEMVLANGDVVSASRDERADLFAGAAGAVGSLGITTLIELRLIEAKRYVKTAYHRTSSVAEAVRKVEAETQNPDNDYVDGILFSKDHGVIITGRLTNDKPADSTPQTFSHARDPWFYLHAQEKTKALGSPPASETTPTPAPVDYIPLAEYLFRYDRGGFWVGAAAFDYFPPVPFTPLFRRLLDDFLHTRMLYRALHSSGHSARFIVQDLALPYRAAESFIDYTTQEFGIWPLWLCPLKQTPPPTFHPHTGEFETEAPETTTAQQGKDQTIAQSQSPAQARTRHPKPMLNVGLWGWGPRESDAFVAKNRALEGKLRDLGGMKWLYAHAYYTEEEFWQVYDKRWYQSLREKYGAATLPTVYDKVKVDVDARRHDQRQWRQSLKARWPVGGIWGVWRSIRSGDYVLHRHAGWKYTPSQDAGN
jgi:Delta24-sterol reductase